MGFAWLQAMNFCVGDGFCTARLRKRRAKQHRASAVANGPSQAPRWQQKELTIEALVHQPALFVYTDITQAGGVGLHAMCALQSPGLRIASLTRRRGGHHGSLACEVQLEAPGLP